MFISICIKVDKTSRISTNCQYFLGIKVNMLGAAKVLLMTHQLLNCLQLINYYVVLRCHKSVQRFRLTWWMICDGNLLQYCCRILTLTALLSWLIRQQCWDFDVALPCSSRLYKTPGGLMESFYLDQVGRGSDYLDLTCKDLRICLLLNSNTLH